MEPAAPNNNKKKHRHRHHKSKKPKRIGVVIVGDAGVGKSSFIECLVEETFGLEYEPSECLEKYTFKFETEKNGLEGTFRLYDVPVHSSETEMKDDKQVWPDKDKVRCGIIMFDVGSIPSYKNVEMWHQKLVERYGKDILLVLCGNKVDTRERKVRPKFITIHHKFDIPYYDVSAKTMVNVEKPFMYFVNRLK